MNRKQLKQEIDTIIAVEATGCNGAGDYLKYARSQGYPFVETLDWSSSAGDWTFIVSKDGFTWYVMIQENNYPRSGGFTRTIDTTQEYYGDAKDVLQEIYEEWN